jgi:hypothetical protein
MLPGIVSTKWTARESEDRMPENQLAAVDTAGAVLLVLALILSRLA